MTSMSSVICVYAYLCRRWHVYAYLRMNMQVFSAVLKRYVVYADAVCEKYKARDGRLSHEDNVFSIYCVRAFQWVFSSVIGIFTSWCTNQDRYLPQLVVLRSRL